MVKFVIDVSSIMDSPNLTISSSPFAPGKSILKRVPYKGSGNVPPWLESYLLPKGTCKGQVGKRVADTKHGRKLVPGTAACVAETRKGARKARKRASSPE